MLQIFLVKIGVINHVTRIWLNHFYLTTAMVVIMTRLILTNFSIQDLILSLRLTFKSSPIVSSRSNSREWNNIYKSTCNERINTDTLVDGSSSPTKDALYTIPDTNSVKWLLCSTNGIFTNILYCTTTYVVFSYNQKLLSINTKFICWYYITFFCSIQVTFSLWTIT